ncbi:MAG: RNA polymerase sigma-70 factor [Bacteroidota bacterium]
MRQTDIKRLKKGSEAAFRKLYDSYYAKVYHYCLRFTRCQEDAEELTQEIFIQLWNQRRSIDPAQSLDGYLFTIAHHQACNFLRQKSRRLKLEFSEAPTTGTSTEMVVLYNELTRNLELAVARLPEKRQIIFRMHQEECLSEEEIAQTLQLSVHTVKSQLAKAAHAIRQALPKAIIINLILLFHP